MDGVPVSASTTLPPPMRRTVHVCAVEARDACAPAPPMLRDQANSPERELTLKPSPSRGPPPLHDTPHLGSRETGGRPVISNL